MSNDSNTSQPEHSAQGDAEQQADQSAQQWSAWGSAPSSQSSANASWNRSGSRQGDSQASTSGWAPSSDASTSLQDEARQATWEATSQQRGQASSWGDSNQEWDADSTQISPPGAARWSTTQQPAQGGQASAWNATSTSQSSSWELTPHTQQSWGQPASQASAQNWDAQPRSAASASSQPSAWENSNYQWNTQQISGWEQTQSLPHDVSSGSQGAGSQSGGSTAYRPGPQGSGGNQWDASQNFQGGHDQQGGYQQNWQQQGVQRSGNSFFGTMFDGTFDRFVTPGNSQVAFIFVIVFSVLCWIITLIGAFKLDSTLGIFVLILGWIPVFIEIMFTRMLLEVWLQHRKHLAAHAEHLTTAKDADAIKDGAKSTAGQDAPNA